MPTSTTNAVQCQCISPRQQWPRAVCPTSYCLTAWLEQRTHVFDNLLFHINIFIHIVSPLFKQHVLYHLVFSVFSPSPNTSFSIYLGPFFFEMFMKLVLRHKENTGRTFPTQFEWKEHCLKCYLSLVLLLLFLALVSTINCLKKKKATSHFCLSLLPTISLFSASLSDCCCLTFPLCLVFDLSCTASRSWVFFLFFFSFSPPSQTTGFSSVALLQLYYTSPCGLHLRFPFLLLHFILGWLFSPLLNHFLSNVLYIISRSSFLA